MNKKFIRYMAGFMAFMILFASVAFASSSDEYDGDDDDEFPVDVIKKDIDPSQMVITIDKCVSLDDEYVEGFFDDPIYKIENGTKKKVNVYAYYFTVDKAGVYNFDGMGNVATRWRI